MAKKYRLVPSITRSGIDGFTESVGEKQQQVEGSVDNAVKAAQKMLTDNAEFLHIDISTITKNVMNSKKVGKVTSAGFTKFKKGGEVTSLPEGWEKQKEWHANPSLGYDSYKKVFKSPRNRKGIPVYVFGKEGSGKNTPVYDYTEKDAEGKYVAESRYIKEYKDFSDWNFVVSGSHSGSFYPETPTLEEALKIIDEKQTAGKLIYKQGGEVTSAEETVKLNTADGYDFYIGSDTRHKILYNIVPQGTPAPKGGYYDRENIAKVNGVSPELFVSKEENWIGKEEGWIYIGAEDKKFYDTDEEIIEEAKKRYLAGSYVRSLLQTNFYRLVKPESIFTVSEVGYSTPRSKEVRLSDGEPQMSSIVVYRGGSWANVVNEYNLPTKESYKTWNWNMEDGGVIENAKATYYTMKGTHSMQEVADQIIRDYNEQKINDGHLWQVLSDEDILDVEQATRVYEAFGLVPFAGFPLQKDMMSDGGEFRKGGNLYDRGERPSPRESATLYDEGFEKEGQDGNMYYVALDVNNVHRWKKGSTPFSVLSKPMTPMTQPLTTESGGKKYKLGDKYSSDFDYDGMLEMGSIANVEWGEGKLNKLFNSFEDVNYHAEAKPLWEAIEAMKKGFMGIAKVKLKVFNNACKEYSEVESKAKGGSFTGKFDTIVGQAIYYIDNSTDFQTKLVKGKTKSDEKYTVTADGGEPVGTFNRLEIIDFAKRHGFETANAAACGGNIK